METERIKALDMLGEAAQAMWDNKQLFFPLVAFLSVISMLMIWPVIDWYLVIFESLKENFDISETNFEQLVDEDIWYVVLMSVPSLLISFSVIVLWSRAVIGGSGIAFEGGWPALIKRVGWSMWRYFCAVGIMLLAGGLLLSPLLLFGEGSGAAIAFLAIAYFLFMYLIFQVMLLLGISLHGEARDFRLPIHKSYKLMKGNLARATGGLLLGVLGIYVVQGMIMTIVIGLILSGNQMAVMIGFFIMIAVSTLFNFLWVGYGAKFAVRVVPELKE